MLEKTEDLVRKAVDFYIGRNPEKARRIADGNGIDYDACVRELFLEKFVKKQVTKSKCFEGFFHVEEVIETVKDTEAFLRFISEQLIKLSDGKLNDVLRKVPKLFMDYRDLILDLLVFKVKDQEMVNGFLGMKKANISPRNLNDYFNAHWKEKGLTLEENLRIAHKIANRFHQDLAVFAPEVARWYRIDLLKKFKNKSFEQPVLAKYFLDLNSDDKKYLVSKVINELINQKQYIEAADFATDFGGENGGLHFKSEQVIAASLAYCRCFENNQFKEAAEITLKYGIGDFHGAAKRELERMEKIDGDELTHGKCTMVNWAIKFGLKLCEDQIFGCNNRPEDLAKVGCMEAARAKTLYLLRECFNAETLEKYFYPGTPYFTEEKALEWVVQRLLYLREFITPYYIQLFIVDNFENSFLKPWGKQKLLDVFFTLWLSRIEESEFGTIMHLADEISSKSKTPVEIELASLAPKATQLALDEGRWNNYRRICEKWLPKQFVKIEKIDDSKID